MERARTLRICTTVRHHVWIYGSTNGQGDGIHTKRDKRAKSEMAPECTSVYQGRGIVRSSEVVITDERAKIIHSSSTSFDDKTSIEHVLTTSNPFNSTSPTRQARRHCHWQAWLCRLISSHETGGMSMLISSLGQVKTLSRRGE